MRASHGASHLVVVASAARKPRQRCSAAHSCSCCSSLAWHPQWSQHAGTSPAARAPCSAASPPRAGIAWLGYRWTAYLVPLLAPRHTKAGLVGNDINKRGTKAGEKPDSRVARLSAWRRLHRLPRAHAHAAHAGRSPAPLRRARRARGAARAARRPLVRRLPRRARLHHAHADARVSWTTCSTCRGESSS